MRRMFKCAIPCYFLCVSNYSRAIIAQLVEQLVNGKSVSYSVSSSILPKTFFFFKNVHTSMIKLIFRSEFVNSFSVDFRNLDIYFVFISDCISLPNIGLVDMTGLGV